MLYGSDIHETAEKLLQRINEKAEVVRSPGSILQLAQALEALTRAAPPNKLVKKPDHGA
ncbi:MAG: hypothetical protein ACK5KO_12970 [Arachnia sp.]